MEKTIQDVIETILTAIPVDPYPDTVDTVKIGDPRQKVTGIATTFMASCAVIEQAIQRGANFIITHEPTFYNHLDATGWLEDVLICGEINEWETNEYVRDALQLRQRKALVIIGHAASEEAGIQEVVPWLQARVPEVPITFIPGGRPFRWM